MMRRVKNHLKRFNVKPPLWLSKRGVRFAVLCLALASPAWVGCADEDDETVATVRKDREKKAQETKIDDSAEKKEIGYVYNAENKRDPFKTYFAELMVQENEQRNLSELQLFDLGALRLTAVVAGTATPMALLEDPTGKGHTIKIGTLVGKKFGQVKQIRRGEVDIQEEFRDFTGRRIKTMKTLKLEQEGEIE